MVIWAIIGFVYMVLLLIDLPSIKKSKSKKVVVVYTLLMILAFVITGMDQLGIQVPSPANLFEDIVNGIIGV